MSEDLGIDLWIKRDDLTGFAGGGNKGRKLEYLMADVIESRAQRVVSCGSRQSNFVRQLGGACSVLGVKCTAAVMTLPFDKDYGKPSGPRPSEGGNLILNDLFGVEIEEFEDGDWLDLFQHAKTIAETYRARGENVYEIPVGGSSPLGAYAFTEAALEVGEGWDYVVTATSSGSTHAGLAWAFHGTRTTVLGVSCDPEEDLADDLVRLTSGIDDLTGLKKSMVKDDFVLRRDWFGAGYNIPSESGILATRELASREAILLDPVYSAKAFAGLLELARTGEIGGRVLFWHTGGLPTLFAGQQA